jgi:hypothetical protein
MLPSGWTPADNSRRAAKTVADTPVDRTNIPASNRQFPSVRLEGMAIISWLKDREPRNPSAGP